MTFRLIVPDFETLSPTELSVAGAWRYAEDPATEVLCLAWTLDGQLMSPWVPNDMVVGAALRALAEDPETIWVAHNAAFEKAIWRNIMVPRYGFPPIPNSRWRDTMASAAMLGLPLGLDQCAQALRVPNQKDSEGSALVRKLNRQYVKSPWDRPAIPPETVHRITEYCERDVIAQTDLVQAMPPLPPGELNVWLLDQRVNERGVRLDEPFIRACQRIVDGAIAPMAAEFHALTGLNVTQTQALLAWCHEHGAPKLPNLQKLTLRRALGPSAALIDDGEEPEDDEEDAVEVGPLPPDVARALTIRMIAGSSSIKKLPSMLGCIGRDGRARGAVQYHGAATGRWAGRLFQPQNFPRPVGVMEGVHHDPETLVAFLKTAEPDLVQAVLGSPIEVVVSALRHAITADREHVRRVLCAADFAQIEARTVLALAGQHDKTALMASGQSPYLDMGATIFGRPISKKDDPSEYQTSKNTVLGCGFQMGKKTYYDRYGKANGQTMEQCEEAIWAYRRDWAPQVPKLWQGLEDAAFDVAYRRKVSAEFAGCEYRLEDKWMTCRLPSGRKLWYFSPQQCRKAMPWVKDDIRDAWRFLARKNGRVRPVYAYGGLLTENVVQALARDLMAAAMFRCEKNGYPVVLTVHDEIVTEPEEAHADPAELVQIMSELPAWGRALQIPVAAEPWIGTRYQK